MVIQTISFVEVLGKDSFVDIVTLTYISPVDGRPHRYYPDFLIEVKEKSGKLKKYVIEIKPKKQTQPPVKKKRVTKGFILEAKTYAVNQAKWTAAVG